MTVKVWPLAEAWDAAVAMASMQFRVEPEHISTESRGRGPRPPEEARQPKKVAVFLTTALTDRSYAEVARFLKLHRDTVASHCSEIRELCAVDPEFERLLDALFITAQFRLQVAPDPKRRIPEDLSLHKLMVALHGRLDRLEARMQLPLHPTLSDEGALHPTKTTAHETVIEFRPPTRSRR